MSYHSEQMNAAWSIARHAYADKTDHRGKLLFLSACTEAEACRTEKEAVAYLLQNALNATNLNLETIRQANFDPSILYYLEKNNEKTESLTA